MRTPIVAGNWKMNKSVADSRQIVSELVPGLQSIVGIEKVVCPPFTALLAVSALLEGTDIQLGAQNMHWEQSGAFTGEISSGMLKEFCRYVILGHSERRKHFAETDAIVNRKVKASFFAGIRPILCVGESLEENEAGITDDVISKQLKGSLAGLDSSDSRGIADDTVIAYEPIWAIGTGRAASPEDGSSVIQNVIRPVLSDLFGYNTAQKIRVLYGGSVTGENASEFFSESEIDGALVGGASLKADDFIKIAQAASTESGLE